MRKNILKDLLKSSLYGIGIACMIFCIVGLVIDASFKDNIHFENYAFSKMAAGAIIVGLGFGLPSVIYQFDAFSFMIKSLIHMAIGLIVLTIVNFAVGWIPSTFGILNMIVTIALEILVAIVIWMIFYHHFKKEAELMNENLRKIK